MDGIEFKELREEQLDDVLSIYNGYVLNSTATFHLHSLTKEEMRRIVFFSSPRYRTYAILSAGTVLGYVLLTPFNPREAYDGTAEVTIYLSPDFTGRGIGTHALAFLEDRARERGFHSLIAVVTAENGASAALFLKCGFSECARYREVGRKFGRLLDVVCFQKILRPDAG